MAELSSRSLAKSIPKSGRVAEWPNASVSKTDSRVTVTKVRILPLPNVRKINGNLVRHIKCGTYTPS